MIDNYFVEIAGITINIQNTNIVANKIIEDLKAVKDNNARDININIEFINNMKDYCPIIFSAKGSMNFNQNEYFVDYLSHINYYIQNIFSANETNIKINLRKSNLRQRIKNIYSNDTLADMQKNIILSYSLFWYILHIELLKYQKSFLHAGVFDIDGSTSIITGTGGCGKTSTLFKILENTDSKYIAEDFGIIDNNGYTYYNPKPVSVYASDIEFGQVILQDYYKKFSKWEQIMWSFNRNYLKRNPMVKVTPSLLINDRVLKKSKVNNVIYFIRNDDMSISIKDIGLNELVDRVLDASMRELKTLNELLHLIKANAPLEYKIPSFEDIRLQTKEIYLNAFRHTKNKIIFIPHNTKPEELVKYLKDNKVI